MKATPRKNWSPSWAARSWQPTSGWSWSPVRITRPTSRAGSKSLRLTSGPSSQPPPTPSAPWISSTVCSPSQKRPPRRRPFFRSSCLQIEGRGFFLCRQPRCAARAAPDSRPVLLVVFSLQIIQHMYRVPC